MIALTSPQDSLFPELDYVARESRPRVKATVRKPAETQNFLFPLDEEVSATEAMERCAARLAENERQAATLTDYRRITVGDTMWLVIRRGTTVETVVEYEGAERKVAKDYPSVSEACLAFQNAIAQIEGVNDRPNVSGRNHKVSLNGLAVVRSEQEATVLFGKVRSTIEAMVAKNRRALAADFVDHDEIRSISEIAAFNACLRWKSEGEGNASLKGYVSSAIQLRIAEAVTAAQEIRNTVRFLSVDETDSDGESLGYERFADEKAWSPEGKAFWNKASCGLFAGWTRKKSPTLLQRAVKFLRRFFGGGAAAV